MERIQLEVIAESVESAIAAEEGGADRLEVCVNLTQGGTTPSLGLVIAIKQAVSIPVFVMIRPRAGNFCYSLKEQNVMRMDIEAFLPMADGFVFGLLTDEGKIDVKNTADLVKYAGGKPVTFHRAFDDCVDYKVGFEQVIETGASRVLTSGCRENVILGKEILSELSEINAGRINILPGGGLTPGNVQEILKVGNFTECHFSAKKSLNSVGTLHATSPNNATSPNQNLYEVDINQVKEMRRVLDN